MPLQYAGGSTIDPSSIDKAEGKAQLNTFYHLRKSLIEARKEQYFSPLASVTHMPKHFGKEIKVYEYVPILDERNINDEGINAAGITIKNDYVVRFPAKVFQVPSADAADAKAALEKCGFSVTVDAGAGAFNEGDGTHSTLTIALGTADDVAVAAGVPSGLAPSMDGGHRLFGVFSKSDKNDVLALELKFNTSEGTSAMDFVQVEQLSGNLYGSSKDVGTVVGQLPILGEQGGRVNRVGFTRLQLNGTIHKFGLFYEWTQDSIQFDSDSELAGHLSRELMNAAVQVTEAVLQKDLLAAAGTIVYAGEAISRGTITGEVGVETVVTYEDLMRLSQALTDKRTPKHTKIITGSRMVDTRTIASSRIMYVGSELVPVLRAMRDLHDHPAFIPVHMYADAANVLNGEIGNIDEFRIVVVPEMFHWSDGAEATEGGNGYRTTGDRYNVYPMLVIGNESFTTIGFQTDGKSYKFSIITKPPGRQTADKSDPYGEVGFSSIKWWYGFLALRPDRIGMILTVAPV